MEELIIVIFLLLGPLLDVSVFYNLPFNLVVRGIYLLLIILTMLKRKKNFKILIPLIVFGTISFIYQLKYLDFSMLDSFSNTFKFLYLPCSILYFKDFEFKKYKKEKVLAIIIFSYIAIYLFSYLTKIGASAYDNDDGKTGFRGLFTSINEFSAIIASLLPIVAIYLKNKKNYFLLGLLLITSIICSLMLGTKILFAGIIITIMYLLWIERKRIFNRNKLRNIIIVIGCITICTLVGYLFTKTRIYDNMETQRDFFDVEKIFSYDYLNRVIFNDRLSFLGKNFNYFINSNIIEMILGIGLSNHDIKRVELDIFDVLFRYGIIGISLFILPFIKNKYKELKSEYKLALVLLLLISLTSGHVLFYPNVCIYIALVFSR